MTAFEDRNAATCVRQIAKYGADCTLTRAGTRTYDTATGEYINSGGGDEPIKALVSDYGGRGSVAPKNVEAGDKQLLVAADGLEKPVVGDTFTVLEDTYRIVPVRDGGLEVQTVMAANKPVLYRIHGRRS